METDTWATIATVSFWVAIIGGSTYFFNKALFSALMVIFGLLLALGLFTLLVALSNLFFKWLFSFLEQ